MNPTLAALQWRRGTLLAWSVVLVVAGSGLRKLELRTDGMALIPEDAAEVRDDAAARQVFGLCDRIIVVLEPKSLGGVFQEKTLQLVAQLTAAFRTLPGVDPDAVVSLATEKSGYIQTGPVPFSSLLNPLPRTEGEIEEVRADVSALRIYSGTLLSQEKEVIGRPWTYRATAILIGVPRSAERKRLCQEIEHIARSSATDDYDLYVVGGPVAESILGDHVLNDLRMLVPATILIMSALFLWLFRSGRFVLVVVAEIGACLVVTFGAMGHAGVPFTIAMMVLPLVIIPVIVADEVHIFTALCRLNEEGARDWLAALEAAVDECWVPIVKTGITTAVSGVVFAISPVLSIREFGCFLSLASLTSMIWTLTAGPVLLAIRREDRKAWGRRPAFEAPEALMRMVTRRQGTTIALILGLPLIPVAIGLTMLQVQDSWTGGFGRRSAFRLAMEKVDTLFDGTQVLYVVFDTRLGTSTRERLLDPEVLAVLAEFERFLGAALGPDGGGLLGAYEQIATARFMRAGRSELERRHGDSAQENADLLRFLEAVIGRKRLRETIDPEHQQAVIAVFLKNANYRDVGALLEKIADHERTHLAPKGIRVGYAGDVWLSQAMIKAISYTELCSIGGSLASMSVLITLMERSLVIGLLSPIPSLLAILANLALMGWLGIPIGVATSMFAGITFGIGVDSSLHFFEQIRGARQVTTAAIVRGLSHVYTAVLVEAVVLASGFSVLLASSVPVNRALGLFLASSFVSCSFLTVCLMPAVCCLIWPGRRPPSMDERLRPAGSDGIAP